MPQRGHPGGDVRLGAGVQLPAQIHKGRAGAAVQPAAHIIPAAVVGDVRRAAGVAVVGEKQRLLVPEARLLHHQQRFALRGAGQKFLRCHGLLADQIGVEEKHEIKAPQNLLPPQKDGKPFHGGVGPGQRLLPDDLHVGGVGKGQAFGIGEHEIVFFAVRQEMRLKAAVKFRPEHLVFPGAEIQHGNTGHCGFLRWFSFCTSSAPRRRR